MHVKHKFSGQTDAAIPGDPVCRAVVASDDPLVIAAKGAIAALCQNATHGADVAAAVTWLRDALSRDVSDPA
jgi:hypothetical protein